VTLGRLRAEFGQGPESKVVVHEKLYNFHLGAMVIRVLHQWIIKLQFGTVNKLMAIKLELGFWEFWKVKLGQIEPSFFYALHQGIISNFYFWLNLSCSTKFGERRMPKSKPMNSGLL
jgi:hypothetical protein